MAAPKNADIKKQILERTASMLEHCSFEAISLADIAREAGISKGTLYYYYHSKDDILFDIADRYLKRLEEDLVRWADDPRKDTSPRRLYRYVLERGVFNASGSMRLFLIGSAAGGREELREKLREKLNEKYRFFSAELSRRIAQRAPGCDPEYTAWLLLTVMDGLLVQTQLNGGLDAKGFMEKTASLLSGMDEPGRETARTEA